MSFIDPFGTGSRRSINDPCVEAGLLVPDADVQRQPMSDDAHRLLILEGFRADTGRALLGIQRDQIEPWLELTGEMLDQDRKSVVSGKSVSARVDLGGPRLSKNNTTH